MLTHTATEHHPKPQTANSRAHEVNREPPVTLNAEPRPDGNEDHRAIPRRKPPWQCDKTIYESRFVRSCFWGSQLGILSLTALFIVFYFELFVPLGVPGRLKLQATLQTDYGIWFIVGCTILGWVGMAILLLTCGALGSSLFNLPSGPAGLSD